MKRPPEPPFSLELPLLSERQNGRQMLNTPEAVSYTHLDVYKRQALEGIGDNILSMPRQQWNRINQMAA